MPFPRKKSLFEKEGLIQYLVLILLSSLSFLLKMTESLLTLYLKADTLLTTESVFPPLLVSHQRALFLYNSFEYHEKFLIFLLKLGFFLLFPCYHPIPSFETLLFLLMYNQKPSLFHLSYDPLSHHA